MSNSIEATITPAALLTAAREGKITASIIDAETLTPLAGGDGPEQYPACTIALYVETPDLRSIEALPGVVGAGTVGEKVILTVRNDALAGLLPILPLTVTQTIPDDDGTTILHGTHPRIPVEKQALRTLTAWKLVYYSVEGDTMNSGRGTYDFRAIESDGCTRGDVIVSILSEPIWKTAPEAYDYVSGTEDADATEEATEKAWLAIMGREPDAKEREEGLWSHLCNLIDDERPGSITIATGEGCSKVESIDVTGLTEDEAEEVRETIESAIEGAYSDWEPEHPSDEEIYAELERRAKKGWRKGNTSIEAEVAGEETKVMLYAGTHCGKPHYAYEGDESETVYEDAEDCAKAAREKLEELLAKVIEETEAKGEEEDDYGDYRIIADRAEKTVTIYSADEAILENSTAMQEVEKARRYAFGSSSKWADDRGCSVDNDHGWQWDVTGHGMDIDDHSDALDKQEREAAEALEASLKED